MNFLGQVGGALERIIFGRDAATASQQPSLNMSQLQQNQVYGSTLPWGLPEYVERGHYNPEKAMITVERASHLDWLHRRLNLVLSLGRAWLQNEIVRATEKTHLHVYQADEDPAPDGIPVLRLQNGDYLFAPATWSIPDEVLNRYRTKPDDFSY